VTKTANESSKRTKPRNGIQWGGVVESDPAMAAPRILTVGEAVAKYCDFSQSCNRQFINGEWVASLDSPSEGIAVLHSATGEQLTQAANGGPKDANAAVSAAETAFPSWSNTSPDLRSAHLNAMADWSTLMG